METAAAKLKPFSDRVDIGLHLNLTHTFASGNLVFPLPMLIVRAWSASLNRELITQCIEEQWDLFVSVLGKQPDFIDGHQHIHQFPFIRDILLQLLKEKNLRVGFEIYNSRSIPLITVLKLVCSQH